MTESTEQAVPLDCGPLTSKARLIIATTPTGYRLVSNNEDDSPEESQEDSS
jgi:hypothetical protein